LNVLELTPALPIHPLGFPEDRFGPASLCWRESRYWLQLMLCSENTLAAPNSSSIPKRLMLGAIDLTNRQLSDIVAGNSGFGICK
jgi:hypothetical protein